MRQAGRKIAAGPPAPAGTLVDEIQQYIPAAYNVSSTLTWDLAAGANRCDFQLQGM